MNFSELFNYNKNDESRIKSVMCLLNCSESEAVIYLKKGDSKDDCKRAETSYRSSYTNTSRD